MMYRAAARRPLIRIYEAPNRFREAEVPRRALAVEEQEKEAA